VYSAINGDALSSRSGGEQAPPLLSHGAGAVDRASGWAGDWAASRVEEVRRLFDEAQRLGGVDIVVANAGAIAVRPFVEMRNEDYEQIFAVNTRGTFYLLREATRAATSAACRGRARARSARRTHASRARGPRRTDLPLVAFLASPLSSAITGAALRAGGVVRPIA